MYPLTLPNFPVSSKVTCAGARTEDAPHSLNLISMLRGATIVNIHTLLKIGVCTVFFDIILIPFYVKTGVFEFSLVEARSRFWEILLR